MTDSDFYNNIEKWIEDDLENWNRITLVAYFCYKYQYKNRNNPAQVPFRLTKSKRSLSSKELSDLSKLFNIFAPEEFKELSKEEKRKVTGEINLKIKNYINWMFDYKFRSGQSSVNGTKIFLSPAIIVEFERMYSQYVKKQFSKNAMDVLLEWCKTEASEIFKKHKLNKTEDLVFIKKYAEQYKLNEEAIENRVLRKAFDLKIMEKI